MHLLATIEVKSIILYLKSLIFGFLLYYVSPSLGQTVIDRKLDIANEFFAHFESAHLELVDIERLKLIEPYISLSWMTDEKLAQLADSARQLMRMNAARYHLDILGIMEEYCGTSSRRENMLLNLQSTIAADSDAVKRGLAGMIQGARTIDRMFLGDMFRTTTYSSVTTEAPHANLLLKCHFQHENYEWISLRVTTLKFDPYDMPGRDSLSSLMITSSNHLKLVNDHTNLTAFVDGEKMRFTNIAATQFTLITHYSCYWLTAESTRLAQTRAKKSIITLSFTKKEKSPKITAPNWPKIVYLIDQDETPCVFFAMENNTAAKTNVPVKRDKWAPEAKLTPGYPPTVLAFWKLDIFSRDSGRILSGDRIGKK